MGEEKVDFLSVIKSFQEEFQEDREIQKEKRKKYWLMEYLNSFVEQKKNDGTKEFARFFSKEDFDEGLEEALISILYSAVEEWENKINPHHLVTNAKMKELGLKPHGNIKKEKILLERKKTLFKN